MDPSSSLPHSFSLEFIEGLYDDYLSDPTSVAPAWRAYFDSLDREAEATPPSDGNGHGPSGNGHDNGSGGVAALHERRSIRPRFRPRSLFNPPDPSRDGRAAPATQRAELLQDRVDQMVRNYRVRGHIIADVNPLFPPRLSPPELEPSFYGFTDAHMGLTFSSEGIEGPDRLTLRDIIARMRATYCGAIGVQFMHIDSLTVRQWLQRRMEGTQNRITLTREEQVRIFTRLTDAVSFEEFIQKKYVGAKSFSLEGGESLIPLLDLAIEKAGEQGVDEVVLGMAHRGRLNVLANIMGKSPRQIFREFEDAEPERYVGGGDVKYHLGHSGDWKTAAGRTLHLSLCFNPSHLEFVGPVAVGRVRAKQDHFGDKERNRGTAILIHGDAAFAGEGVVQETLNLSELPGYSVGGTLHVVVNNQLGFTTSPHEARSTAYSTDVARMLQSPIFHVNGENPEAVAQVVRLAMDFRKKFKRDVVVDMHCFRRRGHNEGDEPSFTQPRMYAAIEKRPNVRDSYMDHLLKLGGLTRQEAEFIAQRRHEHLERELAVARADDFAGPRDPADQPAGLWAGYISGKESSAHEVATGVPQARLAELLERQARVPEGFHPHPKIERLLRARAEMAQGKRPLDWATAEALAFASLVTQGRRVRLTGQDSQRGTFSQRHAVLHDVETGKTYTPLADLGPDQAPLEIVNSPLSETGVLGFDYGYSLDFPDALVLWEAQFGDFVNVAQPIIDQFLVSAEDKWRRLSGLVLLLPHGFEGQGPEHSSARVERFLHQAAEDNIQVVNATTPAQYFHVLRRQVLRRWRKPLVMMTPKSLLRHPKAVSSLDDLASGGFQRVIPDRARHNCGEIRHVLLCTGKVYYELEKKREDLDRQDVAIVRVEQLYPLPLGELRSALAAYPDSTPATWVQEEPENMGAWRFLLAHFGATLFDRLPLGVVSRRASASPATGSGASHKLEQEALLNRAFGGE